ncbi:MAG: Maf family protein [Stellaceae bacterium]
MSDLVLASASAARARLLEASGVAARIDPAAIDEVRIKTEQRARGAAAEDCALLLAEAKALAVVPRHPGALVLGADQMLECGAAWFDKPTSLEEARAKLRALAGREHTLVTAITMVRDERVLWRHLERPRITLRRFSDAFLDFYLDAMGSRALRSVGGYELEGLGAQLVARLEGDYFAVLGLPLLPLLEFLRAQGALRA